MKRAPGLSFVCPGEVNEEVNGEEYLVNGSDWSYGMNVISFYKWGRCNV